MPVLAVKRAVHACCPSVLKPTLARIEASDIGYRLASGAFWSVAGAVISKGLGVVSSIVVARALGKIGFGELGIIQSTVMMFQLFAGFGLGLTATKYVAEYRSADPNKAGRIIGLAWIVTAVTGGICAILLVVLAPWLAAHTLAAPHLSGLLRITALALFISALNAAQGGALSGFEAFKTITTRNLIAGMLNFPIMIAGVLLAGLEGAVWATVISAAVNWILCHLAVRNEACRFHVPLTFTGCLQDLPLLWQFSLPAVLSGMMVVPVNWLCNTILVNQPRGYEEMGVFSVANQWGGILLSLSTVLMAPLLPLLSNMNKDRQAFYRTMLPIQRIAQLGVLPSAVILMLLSYWIVIVYGSSFSGGKNPLIFLIAATGITCHPYW